jgi:hypothetical protein
MSRAAILGVVLLAACSGSGQIVAPVDERNDAEHLQNALAEDPAQLVLEEIDQAIASDRPVMAADLIERSAVPAVRRHIDAVQAVDMGTSAGRTLRSRAVRLLRHRLTALEHWQAALARGIDHEDEALLEAIHENAEAEHELFELHRELAMIRPLETGGPSAIDPEHVLEGLPAITPPAPPSDDDPEPPPPEPDPTAADPIDGREELDEPVLPPEYRDPDDHHAIVPDHH